MVFSTYSCMYDHTPAAINLMFSLLHENKNSNVSILEAVQKIVLISNAILSLLMTSVNSEILIAEVIFSYFSFELS